MILKGDSNMAIKLDSSWDRTADVVISGYGMA
jgi:hypothetical protein